MRTVWMAVIMVVGLTLPAAAETVHVGVNGLVCAFCAKGLEAGFEEVEAVASVVVDLDEKLVTITTKDQQVLSDEAITETITDAGYTVTGIHRQD